MLEHDRSICRNVLQQIHNLSSCDGFIIHSFLYFIILNSYINRARCSSVVRAFAHGSMGCQIEIYGEPIELFLVPASAPRLV